jgi:preprotein translocase subunit SecA
MNDIYNTFTERFLKVQLVFEPPAPPPPPAAEPAAQRATKRYNAMGILEDIQDEAVAVAPSGVDAAVDIGPAEEPPTPASATPPVATRKDPTIVGAGRPRSLNAAAAPANVDWSTVGRNDPCPCGSGKKFKKCHGANL